MRVSAAFFRPALSTAAIVSLLLAVIPTSGQALGHKHHIGLGIGYYKLFSDDLENPQSGIDFTNAGLGGLSYRLSFQPTLDLAIDARGTVSTENVGGVDFTLQNTFFGPGIRFSPPSVGVRPFVQGNLYFVEEQIEMEEDGLRVSASDSDIGFGVSGGLDIPVSELVSIPIEANFMYASPADNVSGFAISTGIVFNFGVPAL